MKRRLIDGGRRRRERGTAETEYLMITAFFVIPFWICIWIAVYFLRFYFHHISFSVLLPFP
jgi:hypothetical protein